uniref:Uncharacterized protein n=1 Tax=Arion vulgaris TaxID=1028688 RepID=A0A0B7AHQ2_9EUPU
MCGKSLRIASSVHYADYLSISLTENEAAKFLWASNIAERQIPARKSDAGDSTSHSAQSQENLRGTYELTYW